MGGGFELSLGYDLRIAGREVTASGCLCLPVCTENAIRVDGVTESRKLAE